MKTWMAAGPVCWAATKVPTRCKKGRPRLAATDQGYRRGCFDPGVQGGLLNSPRRRERRVLVDQKADRTRAARLSVAC